MVLLGQQPAVEKDRRHGDGEEGTGGVDMYPRPLGHSDTQSRHVF